MEKFHPIRRIAFLAALALAAAVGTRAQADHDPDWDMSCPGTMGGRCKEMMGGGQSMLGMGMMGRHRMGMGRGFGAVYSLSDLTQDQRDKINKIADDERKKNWPALGQLMDLQAQMRDLWEKDQPDPKKVGDVYGQMAKLRQQMIETHVKAMNDAESVLTPEQRKELKGRMSRHGGSRMPEEDEAPEKENGKD